MAPEEADSLCGGWVWDPAMRELRNYQRKGKKWEEEPAAVERLERVRSVTWHRWGQAPMQTPTGEMMPAQISRVVVEYEDGRNLTINEYDRECAGLLARTVASTFGVEVVEEGAPGGRRDGNLPQRDEMGRLVNRSGRMEVVLDEAAGEITVSRKKRLFGKSRQSIPTRDVRRLELTYEVKGPLEVFTVWAVVGPEEERLPLASYEGYEGWADPGEWRPFAEELARWLGVEVDVKAE